MKLLMENWRAHLQEQELNEFRKEILNELSEKDYAYIKDWMRDAPDEAYSFHNLFGGKKRIAIPALQVAAKGEIGEIINFFQDSGWDVNLKNSTVSREMTKTIPKGPRAGETVTTTETQRIGKMLEKAQQLCEKYVKLSLDSDTMADDILPSGPTTQAQKAARANEAQIRKFFPAITEHGREVSLSRRLPALRKFWESVNGAQHFRKHPEEAYEKDPPVVILSRHPVDVVRMSDMNQIRSCHARDPKYGGYFHCAVAESRGHGPIAYMVPRDQFEEYFDVDLDQTRPEDVDLDAGAEEIFADEDRGIPGLKPEGRLRLRKFVSNEDGRMLAVPETKTYAPGTSVRVGRGGFINGVRKWALENQKDVIGDPDVLADEVYAEEWTRHGGSYEDTLDGGAFSAFLEPLISVGKAMEVARAGNMPTADPHEEEESEIQTHIDSTGVDAEAQEIQDYANEHLTHFGVYHEVMDEEFYDGMPRVYFTGHVAIELGAEFGQPTEGDWDDYEHTINDIMKKVFSDHYIEIESYDADVNAGEWRTTIPLSYEDTPDVDGFRLFVDTLIRDGDGQWEDILNSVREEMLKEELIEPEIDRALRQFDRYVNLNVKVDTAEREINVFLKKPISLLKNWRIFKELPMDTQETIKQAFNSRFVGEMQPFLLSVAEHVGSTAEIFLIPAAQGINVDLQGINLRFHMVIKYDDRNHHQINAAKRMLNRLNTIQQYRNIEEIAFRAFHQTMKKYGVDLSENKSKTHSLNDRMLFANWRRYLNK